jgi:DUF971 family protein
MTDGLKPLSIRNAGDCFSITWSDGAAGTIPFARLRKECPCATCNDERGKPADPFRVLTEREIQAGPPRPVKMAPRGYYAYHIVWNDGHDTGIYSLEMLRSLTDFTPVTA